MKQCPKCLLQVKKQYISESLPTTVTTVADVHASCDDPTTASATTDVTSTPNAEAATSVNLSTTSSNTKEQCVPLYDVTLSSRHILRPKIMSGGRGSVGCMESFVDRMHKAEQSDLDELFSRAIYATGTLTGGGGKLSLAGIVCSASFFV